MSQIHLQQVSKSFNSGRVSAVKDVELTIDDGEFFVLLGPSGCGKTTLLRTIAGLEYADSGDIAIGDKDVTMLPPRRRDIAMVFQNYAIFPHLTVFKNIAFGLRMQKVASTTVDERVRRAADLVELSDYLDRRPAQLSGGQRQRVAVARAIAVEPSVLLMDEPLSNLDALLRLNFRADLKRLVRELKTTTIYVTHDQVEALSLGDRVAVMRDGEIVQCGTPKEVYDQPVNRFVGGFIGNPPMNFIETLIDREDGRPRARVGDHAFAVPDELAESAGQVLLAGIRAENLTVAMEETAGSLPGRVKVVEPLGSQLLVTLSVADQTVKLLTGNDFPAADNAPLWVRPVTEKIRWFDPETDEEMPIGRE